MSRCPLFYLGDPRGGGGWVLGAVGWGAPEGRAIKKAYRVRTAGFRKKSR